MFINAGVLPKDQKNIDNLLLEIKFLDYFYYAHTNTHISDLNENMQSEDIQDLQQPLRHARRASKIPKQPKELLEIYFEEIKPIQEASPIPQPIIPQVQISHSPSSNEVAQNQADLSQIRHRTLLNILRDIKKTKKNFILVYCIITHDTL